MKTYCVENDKTHKKYTIQASNKNDLKKKMIEKCPNGKYTIKDKEGKIYNSITLNHYSKPILPKAEYDNLYFYITEQAQERVAEREFTPQQVSSRKRYTNIADVRKSALAKSYANFKVYQQLISSNYPQLARTVDSPLLYVYKGSTLLGEVYCSPLAKAPYKGTGVWNEYVRYKGNPIMSMNQYRLFKDGSIEKM